MSIKKLMIKLHMILGLVSGVIVFVISITGAMYAFKIEIESVTQTYRRVKVENKEMIPPSEAIKIGAEVNPGIPIHGVVYREPDDALEVVYYRANPQYYGASYLNPYSGELIKTKDFIHSFFGFALHGHIALWLPLKTGMPIVAIAALIFLVMLITGIIVWWPKKWKAKGNFTFHKKARPPVRWLELHKVVGFYVFWIALILVLTGMVWVFKGFGRTVYKAMGGDKEVAFTRPPSDTTKAGHALFEGEAIDVAWKSIKAAYPNMPLVEVHAVEGPESPILIELNREPATYWKMDYLFLDQYTLEPIEPNHIYGRFEAAGFPEKVRRMNYDIHTGGIAGLPGKIIVFLVSLFCASLPVTGYILWWNRQKEKKAFKNKLEF